MGAALVEDNGVVLPARFVVISKCIINLVSSLVGFSHAALANMVAILVHEAVETVVDCIGALIGLIKLGHVLLAASSRQR
jgi:hypothetical protein